jgi:hypothetical protein
MALPTLCMHWTICALFSGLLLGYPIKTRDVHPFVQFAICSCLTTVGLDMAIASLVCESSSCDSWVLLASFILSLVTVIMPAIGALAGLATACGLLAEAIVLNTMSPSSWIGTAIVYASVLTGAAVLFVNKDMFLVWQLFAPPVVGGFLAASACASWISNEGYVYLVWVGSALVSLGFHIRRRRINTWLETKKDLAVHSKESQIVTLMRSANPQMNADEFEKLKEKLLGAVQGEREQVDRIVFGGGLY